MTSMFLSKEEIAVLTGRKTKSKQIEALRKMGVPFFVNAINAPVVTRVAVEGNQDTKSQKPTWRSDRLTDTPNLHAFDNPSPHQLALRAKQKERENKN